MTFDESRNLKPRWYFALDVIQNEEGKFSLKMESK